MANKSGEIVIFMVLTAGIELSRRSGSLFLGN
jgi:hypothetical protein